MSHKLYNNCEYTMYILIKLFKVNLVTDLNMTCSESGTSRNVHIPIDAN
jgi:hypothetical protein